MPTTIAQHLVTTLIGAGFSRLYCLPGYQNDDFFDALYDHQSQLKPVHTRHEQGAAFMALGAALATGKPQVCSVVPGPGLLNASAALATAWSANAPVLMIVGQTPAATYGHELGELHEIPDQMAIIRQFCKLAWRIDNASLAAQQIEAAIAALSEGRPRPVAIEVPMDMWNQPVAPLRNAGDAAPLKRNQDAVPAPPSAVEIETVATLLSAAHRPMIVVGSGALNHGATILKLARAIGAPVMSNRSGRGIIDARDPLSLPAPVGCALWKEMDCVIGLGSRLGAKLAIWGNDSALSSVHIDIDEHELNRGERATLALHADLAKALPKLLDMLPPQRDRADWQSTVKKTRQEIKNRIYKELAPQAEYLSVIRAALPDTGILVPDITQLGYAADTMYPSYFPRTHLSSIYQGTLGWAIPTALGAADAMPDQPVVAICGDGGAMYSLQELATAQLHHIPVTIIIFDDASFANVRRFQIEKFGNRVIATDLYNPDFVDLAKSFGVVAYRAQGPHDLEKFLAKSIEERKTTVIAIKVGDFPSPWPFLLPRKYRGESL